MNRHDMIFFNSILFLVIIEVLAVAFDNVGVASIAVVAMATEFASWKMIMVSDERARRRMERRRARMR